MRAWEREWECPNKSIKSHILHNILFREIQRVVHSVVHLLDLRLLYQQRRVLGVVRTPTTSAHSSLGIIKLTFWYRLIALTTAINASSTLTRCLADVSIHWALNRFARSRPSVHERTLLIWKEHVPWGWTWRSYSKSHLLATTTTGKKSLSFTYHNQHQS